MRSLSRCAGGAMLAAAALAAGCAGGSPAVVENGGGFDLGASVAALAETRDSLDQAERLLPLAAEPERSVYRRRLAALARGLGDLRTDSADAAAGLREAFVRRFTDLPPAPEPRVTVGVRHRPLLPSLPANLVAVRREGRLEISRTAGGPGYEACLEPGLPEGGRAVVRFRLQTRWSEGITPVPYLGVRDGRGVEEVLVFLPENPDPDRVHEVHLERAGGRLAALSDGRVHTVGGERLGEDARIFFQVNATARILVDDYRVTPAPDP